MATKTKKRVIFYIDGFNFYFGLKDGGQRWQKYYWIDIVKLCECFLSEDEELVTVNYYTAEPQNGGKRQRQGEFLKVNKKLNPSKFKIIKGKYKKKPVKCLGSCGEEFETYEEKETDVKIAIDIIEKFILDSCDKTILISADTDLLPPLRSIERLKNNLGKEHEILVMFPPNRHSNDIKNSFSILHLKSHKPKFNKAHLPHLVKCPNENIEIPQPWKKYTVC